LSAVEMLKLMTVSINHPGV